jgi:hypothetical protein
MPFQRNPKQMENLIPRTWDELIDRVGGPLTFRFILQPTVAVVLAIRSGLKDAREGRAAFFWAVLWDPAHRLYLLRQGWRDVRNLVILAVVLDVIYQLLVLHWVYVDQLLIVAAVLAVVPYLVARGPANRIASLTQRRRGQDRKEEVQPGDPRK